MNLRRRSPALRVAGWVLAAALAACAGPEKAPPPTADAHFPVASARQVFSNGYRHVYERYINQLTLEGMTMAGLGRLSTIAPTLAVARAGDKIEVMTADHRAIGEFRAPAEGDAAGWAQVTASVVDAGYPLSPELREASTEKIYSTVFDGVLAKLDGFSRYASAQSAENARASREGFGGIGITLRMGEGRPVVASIMPGTPADTAGVKVDDQLVAIDGTPITSDDLNGIVHRLRGPVDTPVQLTIARTGTPGTKVYAMTRTFVVPSTVEARRDGNYAYFRVSSFNRQTTASFARDYARLSRDMGRDLKGIILDLRGNAGGLLDQAVGLTNSFLNKGLLIVSTQGRHPDANQTSYASANDVAHGLPIVVLVNNRSASATEVVAAALQDWGRAAVVGSASHGKGSVQNVARMPNGGEMVVTWSRMHAPSGYMLDGLGVLPGVCTNADVVKDGDPLAQRRGGREDAAPAFDAWHRYDQPDPALARTLRQACPGRDDEPDQDLVLARTLLANRTLYEQALRPWMATMTAENRPAARARP